MIAAIFPRFDRDRVLPLLAEATVEVIAFDAARFIQLLPCHGGCRLDDVAQVLSGENSHVKNSL